MRRFCILLLSTAFLCTVLFGCNKRNTGKGTAKFDNNVSSSQMIETEEPYAEITEIIQTEAPLETSAPSVVRLEDVFLMDSNHYNLKTGGFTDSVGNSTYDKVHYYMGLNKSHWLADEPWSLHFLNKQYKSFSGTIVLPSKDERDASFYVHIYADEKLIYSVNDVTKTGGAVDFEVDVTGCEQLEIRTGETSRAGYSDGFDLGIVNTVLK